MRIVSGDTTKKLSFYGPPSLTGFAIRQTRDGGNSFLYTTPTVAEDPNQAGLYHASVDEDVTLSAGSLEESVTLRVTHADMPPQTFYLELVTAPRFRKNVAFAAFPFDMFLADGSPATGKTVTAERSINGGAFAATSNAPSEISAGAYKVDLSNADLNGNSVKFKFTATGCRPTVITVYPAG